MSSQFIINYYGTKYKESKELNGFDFSKYLTIIEPFGGSFGFSRYLYEIRELKHLKFIIYDNDEELINFYNHIKILILNGEIYDFINEYNNTIEILKNEYSLYKLTGLEKDKKLIQKKPIKEYLKILENKNLRFMLMKNIDSNQMSSANYKKNIKFLDMFLNTEFIFNNFNKDELIKYDKNTTLIYLDPPYLLSFNDSYKDYSGIDFFFEDIEYTIKNYNTIFIHVYNFLIHRIFLKYEKLRYTKRYGISKKINEHVIYINDI
jgi:site-specific DNA-adenine methylase